MLTCPRCAHQNLPSSIACSACGASLSGSGGPAASVPGGEEYARLVADRAAAQARQRKVFAVVGVLALGLVGVVWYRDYEQKQERQRKLDIFESWAERDKRETGAFFACAMASEVDMNVVSNAQQIQMRLESAYATQQKTFADYLLSDCVPRIERARQAFEGLRDSPAELATPLDAYRESLPKLQEGLEDYAAKIKDRKQVKDVDQLIQETGNAWHTESAPSPQAVAFEKFIHCAIPKLTKMKDAQALLEHLAEACYKGDPVAFMDDVRSRCGAILTDLEDGKPRPSKTWALSQKRFYEEEARQLRAWDDCGRRSRKGKKSEDLGTFLAAVGKYMEARSGVVKAAREIREASH